MQQSIKKSTYLTLKLYIKNASYYFNNNGKMRLNIRKSVYFSKKSLGNKSLNAIYFIFY